MAVGTRVKARGNVNANLRIAMSGRVTAAPLFTVNHGTNGGASGNSESIAFDAARNLLFVMGGAGVDVLNAADGALVFTISKARLEADALAAGFAPGGVALSAGRIGSGNSVAVSGDTLAFTFDGGNIASVPPGASLPGAPGFAFAYTLSGLGGAATASFKGGAAVGAVPDMITFTPDGTKALVSIEGEPRPGYAAGTDPATGAALPGDPAGGITVIDVASWTSTFVGLGAFDAQAAALRAAGVKLANSIPSAGLAPLAPSVDLEPEYIAVSPDGSRAFVTMQENNAIGVFDLTTNSWTAILPLGLANHSLAGGGIDTSDRDGGPIIRQVPIFGPYQPDGIALFVQSGRTFLVTANEGDAREYGGASGVFNEPVRISALVPATGATPPAGMPALDPALLAVIQPRRGDADLGRLEVSRWAGDTDNDGDLDHLQAYGSRSFTVWEVGGTPSAPTLTLTFDSRQLIDQIIASQFPARYDDNRSDNKGAEPENITLGMVDGALHAFVGLERANANMVFRIDNPTSPTYVGLAARTGDTGPETSAFLPATGGQPARLAVANEVSGTTTVFSVAPTPPATFTLQILHGSDFEAGLLASGRARQFAAIVDRLEDALPNSITLSGGDNFIPGPFAAAGTDPSVIPVLRAFYARQLGVDAANLTGLFGNTPPFFSADIALLNAIGIQASVLGNHDFDLGTNPLNAVVDFAAGTSGTTLGRITNIGAQFPYLSANLDFSADTNIRAIVTQTLREASTYVTTAADVADNQAVANEAADAQIAPWTTIVEGGQTIGILGVTTQILAAISSPGLTRVLDPAGDGGRDNMAELASILQPLVDQMQAQGINKIVLLSHLQQYANELALAPLLRGVDVIVSAGSHALFDNPGGFPLRPGETPVEGYPVFRTGADGNPVAIVSSTGEYAHVGRLVVTFDANGVLIPDTDGPGGVGIGGVDPSVSGAIATTDANVATIWGSDNPYAPGTRGFEAQAITNAVSAVLFAKDGNLFGRTDVFLEGRRNEVRSEETNLGNLTADANLFVARQADSGVSVSIKNGGGIRAEIGAIVGQPIPEELPPLANPGAGKPAGAVSQLDIENSLRFNNSLTILAVTAANLERIVEHAVAAWTPTATPGQFGQFGGLAFSFDPSRVSQVITQTGPANDPTGASVTREGERVRNLVVTDGDGNAVDTLVRDGVFQGDPNRVIEVVTLNFLAGNGSPGQRFLGGDSYPFPLFTIPGTRVDLLNSPLLGDGAAGFAAKGSEQDALAEFLLARHGTPATAFDVADTTPLGDLRIQNLNFRADTVGNPFVRVEGPGGEASSVQTVALPAGGAQQFALAGTGAAETFLVPAAAGNIQIDAGGGGDRVFAAGGNDLLRGNDGDDEIAAGAGNDTVGGGAGDDLLQGNAGADILLGEAGRDELQGGDGDDTLYGGAGPDLMQGGIGNDTYQVDHLGDVVEETAGEGTDSVVVLINGWTAADAIENTFLFGSATLLFGSGGGDVLVANQTLGSRLFGNSGGDQLWGGAGNDELQGGAGRDVLRALAGNDTLNGGAGDDQLVGGEGADLFVFDAPGWGRDEVFDFNRAEGDRIDLRGSGYVFADLSIQQIGSTARVEVAGDRMDFYSASNLTAADFLFA
jgi:2',3'-cyclic-nucleotide 2'-phosphodiesterase (5'-nucleotidase family)